jgi:hypothetical protein
MLRLVSFAALVAAAHGFSCEQSQSCGATTTQDCSKTTEVDGETVTYEDYCYYHPGSLDAGCLPTNYLTDYQPVFFGNDYDYQPGCDEGGLCWCDTDKCNTKAWHKKFLADYVFPDRCYEGIAGDNTGPECTNSAKHDEMQFETTNCMDRVKENECDENNEAARKDDLDWGCHRDDKGSVRDEESCKAHCAEDEDPQNADDSADGSTNHCQWLPAISDPESACQVDDQCTYEDGECNASDEQTKSKDEWDKKRGTKECDKLIKFGCFENNDHMGETEECTDNDDANTCNTYTAKPGGMMCPGTCSGTLTGTDESPCEDRFDEGTCDGNSGCTWTSQCCKWTPEPADAEDTCVSGGGTETGLCAYSDGNGAPGKKTVGLGFEHGLFRKDAGFDGVPVRQGARAGPGGCAVVASFRNGKGSASALGADRSDLVGSLCGSHVPMWKSLGEHVGHTDASIDEYCKNFIPGGMDALSKHAPSTIIAMAKNGDFSTLFGDLMFIVTAKPDEYGECLFAGTITMGFGICTCDTAGCNGQTALEMIVDQDTGPMRLLQFLDGSLADFADTINAIVGFVLMDADGMFDPTVVSGVTEVHVTQMMDIEGLAAKTNQEELQGIINDYTKLQSEIDACKNDGVCIVFSTEEDGEDGDNFDDDDFYRTAEHAAVSAIADECGNPWFEVHDDDGHNYYDDDHDDDDDGSADCDAGVDGCSVQFIKLPKTIAAMKARDFESLDFFTEEVFLARMAKGGYDFCLPDGFQARMVAAGWSLDNFYGKWLSCGQHKGDPTSCAAAGCSSVEYDDENDENDDDHYCQAHSHHGLTDQNRGTPAAIELKFPLDVDLKKLTADEVENFKAEVLAVVAKNAGFAPGLVARIELYQEGKLISGRQRRANAPITVKVIFRYDADIDLGAATSSMNKAIEAGDVSVSIEVGGETITATVTELAVAKEAEEPKTTKSGGLSNGALAGIIVGVLVCVAIIAVAMIILVCDKGTDKVSPLAP